MEPPPATEGWYTVGLPRHRQSVLRGDFIHVPLKTPVTVVLSLLISRSLFLISCGLLFILTARCWGWRRHVFRQNLAELFYCPFISPRFYFGVLESRLNLIPRRTNMRAFSFTFCRDAFLST